MALEAGTQLGAFEITARIGVGGMGEVYRATDTRLGREVAIKTLPSALANDPDRLARFEREAKLLAALNHAHIGSVFSLDEHEGTRYLAMELVEGETLEEKLGSGPLPAEEALRLALQIAEALEAAHEKGIIHRDLKPANVMLTPEGVVKVLDFGLAKAFSGNPNETSPLHSPALSLAMTQAGLVLGSAGYMSPEQASGQATDQRADIWAFAVVLYEMLSGQPLFSGESVPHILADVLKSEPDWRRLPKRLHPRLKLLLERCLAKRPHDRLHSIADARLEIEAVLRAPEGVTPAASSTVGGPASVLRLVAGIAAGAIIAGAAAWFARPVPGSEPGPVVKFSVPLPDGSTFVTDFAGAIGLSRDGTQIAYHVGSVGTGGAQLYVRNIGELEGQPVPGTAESRAFPLEPAFSPDGRSLVYVSESATNEPFVIKRVPIDGGEPLRLYETEGIENLPRALTWPTPDTIMFASAEGVVRIPPTGGEPEVLIPANEGEVFFSAQLLPGNEAVLFTQARGALFTAQQAGTQVLMQTIGANDRTVVLRRGFAGRYHGGYLIYTQGAALFAVAFDLDTRTVRGEPVQVALGLDHLGVDGGNFHASDTGTLIIARDGRAAGPNLEPVESTLTWVYRDGREEALPIRPDDYARARVSPDGTKVALVVGTFWPSAPPPSLWLLDLRTQTLSQLATNADSPVWSADGRRILFRLFRGAESGVYAIEPSGGEPMRVGAGSPFAMPSSISQDDEVLALMIPGLSDASIATLSLADGEFQRLSGEPGDSEPSISPSGAWIAHQGGVGSSTGSEISIRPFPDVARSRSPVGSGAQPVFSADGSELFFVGFGQSQGGLMAASVRYEPDLAIGMPRRLFENNGYRYGFIGGRGWDVDPSGERFLMIQQLAEDDAGESLRPRIDVTLNWFEELAERLPIE